MKKSQLKLFFLIIGIFILISLVISPLRSEHANIAGISGFKLSSIVGFVIIYLLTICILHRYKDKLSLNLITIAMLIGIAILTLPTRILNFSETLASDLEYLIHLLSVLAARACYSLRGKKYIAVTFSLLVTVVVLVVSVKGYDLWINKLNYGTFTGKVEQKDASKLSFETSKGEQVSLEDFRGKYLIIDCWHTYCGYCYRAFPKVQELYDKYQDDTLIQIIALHSRIQKNGEKEDFSTGEKILKEHNYTFPCYSIDIENNDLKEVGVSAYPVALIFDPQGKLVFRGKISDVEDYLNGMICK